MRRRRVIGATYVVLSAAFVCFAFRLLRGPSLADRVIALDGMLVVGLSIIVVHADGHRARRVPAGGGDAHPGRLHRHRGGGPLHRGAGRMIGEAIVLFGAVLTLLAAIGVVRFPDTLSRMHALTKASTSASCWSRSAPASTLTTANDITSVLLAAGLQLFTLPVAANLIAHSTYWAAGIPVQLDGDDELRQAADTGRLGRRRLRRSAPAAGDDTDQSPPR